MAEYINREVLRDELLNISIDTSNLYGCGVLEGLDRATKRLNEQPAADVAPVRHGRWIDKGEYAVCMECGGQSGTQYDGVEPIPLMTQFCPNCGAKMDGGAE